MLHGFCWFNTQSQIHADQMALALTAVDTLAAKAADKVAAVFAIENSEALEQGIYLLPLHYRVGVRTMNITHSISTHAGDG